jgi:hypothetical protein
MDILVTSMVLLVGSLLAIALAIAGWEAMQRSVTEQLAREALMANAQELERPFLPSCPAPGELPVAATGPPAPATPGEPERRRTLVDSTLAHAARPAAPASAKAASPEGWPDTEPMASIVAEERQPLDLVLH